MHLDCLIRGPVQSPRGGSKTWYLKVSGFFCSSPNTIKLSKNSSSKIFFLTLHCFSSVTPNKPHLLSHLFLLPGNLTTAFKNKFEVIFEHCCKLFGWCSPCQFPHCFSTPAAVFTYLPRYRMEFFHPNYSATTCLYEYLLASSNAGRPYFRSTFATSPIKVCISQGPALTVFTKQASNGLVTHLSHIASPIVFDSSQWIFGPW